MKRELEHAKASLQTTDVHTARFRNEAQAEIDRLKTEVTTKTQAIQLLEDTLNGGELTEEQKKQLKKASLCDQFEAELKKAQTEMKVVNGRIQELEKQLHTAEVVKGELEQLREENGQVRIPSSA